uniref:Uncharacterized protein n=1 Tax=Biomphalaria glabrata TaxID=6526 RepID=A0A2C9JZ88_BIOGL
MSTSPLSDASLASGATASSNNTIESSRSMHSSLDNSMDSVSISSESTEYFSSSLSDPECLSNVPWSIYNVQEYFRDGPTSPCSTSSASITPTSASECPSRFQHLYLTRNVAFSELDLIDEYIRECLKKENRLLNEAKRNDSNIPKTSETSNKLGRSKKSRKRSADSDDSDDSSESETENGHTDSEYLNTVYYDIPCLPKIKRITSEMMEASNDIDGLILLKKMHDDMRKNWRFDLSFSESISFMQSIRRRYAPFMPSLSSHIESPPDSPEKSPRSKVPRLSMEDD